MNKHTSPAARFAAAALIAGSALSLVAAPASAGSRGNTSSSGMTASTQWVEFGSLPGINGNIHVGDLFIDASTRQAYAYGSVRDWTCPAGERPPSGGGHGVIDDEPTPEETNCIDQGIRFIGNNAGDITFTMDKKLAKARLTGNLTVSSHGTSSARPPVDMTLTGFGAKVTESQRGSYSDGTNTSNFSYSNTYRQATVTGKIGAMGFNDDADDESSGQMGTYKSMYRWSSK